MKIGINAFFQYSFFSNGAATAMLSLATALQTLGHTIVLINTNNKTEWFDDCLSLKDTYERRNLVEWTTRSYEQLDMFIDIDGFIVSTTRFAMRYLSVDTINPSISINISNCS